MKKNLLIIILMLFSIASTFAKEQGYLGIVIKTVTNEKVNGVQVVDVIENGAASLFGINENDIITAVNGIAVQKQEELITTLSKFFIDDVVTISFSRDGKQMNKKVSLGKKAEIVTIKMTKTPKDDGEHWFFADDKTELVLDDANKPISFSKTDDNGKVKTLQLASLGKNTKVPQQPNDVSEKLGYVKQLLKDRERCGCNCPITQHTFYKIPKSVQVPEAKKTLNTEFNIEKFSIAPNPTDGRFTIEFSTKEQGTPQLSIIDLTGRVVQTEVIQNFTGEFSKQYNLDKQAKGAYIIQLRINDKLTTKKIILQ